jgi:drug/metabolite transporter (DMT)-like permease
VRGVGARERHIGALAQVGATSLWGISSGVLSATDASPLWLLAIYGLVIGVPMLLWGVRVRRPWRTRWVLMLLAIDLVNIGGFFVALGIAPVGPVVALHLSSPVLLVLYELVVRRRPVTAWRIASLCLVVLGCTLAAWSAGTSGGGQLALLGLALALLSAVAVALTNVFAVRLSAAQGNWQVVVGGASVLRGGACTALALVTGASLAGDAPGILTVAVVAAVGVVLMWAVAAPRLAPRTLSVIGLNEAVVATLVAVIAFEKPLGPAAALATVIILVAIAVEVLEPSPASERTLAAGAPG